ncbi:MAG: FRG domain-containing protein [Victivallaceae bacterium]|nr:FRG domain-containing protein [Victivallaceae bacterium]
MPKDDEQAMPDIRNEVETLEDALSIFLRNSILLRDTGDGRVLMYRGQANSEFDLSPGIFRNDAIKRESQMIRELKRLAPSEFVSLKSPLDRLIKMQHYGLPTRLLDITSNPLVALFFSCSDPLYREKSGEVITFYDYFESPDSARVDLYARLSTYEGTTHVELQKYTGSPESFSNQENCPIVDRIKKYFPQKYLFVSAPLNNERIRRQHGAFLLFGLNADEQINPFQKETFDIKKSIITDLNDGICRSFVIPAGAKEKILGELDSIGINHAFLFPELEHQASYIKQKYLDLMQEQE